MEKNTKQLKQQQENKTSNGGNIHTRNTQKTSSEEKKRGQGRSINTKDNRRGHARGARGRGQKSSAFGRARKGRGGDQPKSEFETRVLSARRVSRVVAGGRRFNLSVAVAVGNRKGKVGIGTGKGFDMAAAMEKARNQAQKNLIEIKMTGEKSIPSETVGKYCASVIQMRPSKGFVAGGAVRIIAELAGIENINAKIQSRSKNHLNNARATMKAFALMKG